MKIAILIPAYNESKCIGQVVIDLRRKQLDVIVVDDGSADDTGAIAKTAGAIVVTQKINKGKGASMKLGFSYVLNETDYDGVLIMDGDGQHAVSDVQKFIDCAKANGGDIVVGNRMSHTKNMPFIRMVTNKVMSSFLSGVCKQSIPDSQCGFRFVNRKVIESVELVSSNYDTESEMLIKASKRGFKITSVPVRTVYKGEHSDIRPGKDSLRFFKLIVRSYFGRD